MYYLKIFIAILMFLFFKLVFISIIFSKLVKIFVLNYVEVEAHVVEFVLVCSIPLFCLLKKNVHPHRILFVFLFSLIPEVIFIVASIFMVCVRFNFLIAIRTFYYLIIPFIIIVELLYLPGINLMKRICKKS